MKLFDEIRSLIKAIVVTKHELASIRESLSKLEGQFDRNETSLIDVRERVARLEALQDAIRARIEADLIRFQAEIERAEIRRTRLLPAPPKGKK